MDALPRDIQIGMKVYDNDRKHIGKVDDFKFAENADFEDVEAADLDGTEKQREPSIMGVIGEVFGAEELPQALRDRLLMEGYVRIDADGLFAGDRYILPEQIASASGQEMMLNVGKDQLLRTQ